MIFAKVRPRSERTRERVTAPSKPSYSLYTTDEFEIFMFELDCHAELANCSRRELLTGLRSWPSASSRMKEFIRSWQGQQIGEGVQIDQPSK